MWKYLSLGLDKFNSRRLSNTYVYFPPQKIVRKTWIEFIWYSFKLPERQSQLSLMDRWTHILYPRFKSYVKLIWKIAHMAFVVAMDAPPTQNILLSSLDSLLIQNMFLVLRDFLTRLINITFPFFFSYVYSSLLYPNIIEEFFFFFFNNC